MVQPVRMEPVRTVGLVSPPPPLVAGVAAGLTEGLRPQEPQDPEAQAEMEAKEHPGPVQELEVRLELVAQEQWAEEAAEGIPSSVEEAVVRILL